MQEFMQIYKANQKDIEKFLIETIHNVGDVESEENEKFKKLYDVFPSLELVYVCDKNSFKQTSENIYRNKVSNNPIGKDRAYLLSKFRLKDKDINITEPYVSSASGKTCVTIAKQENGNIYFLDFNINSLLQRLGLIEIQKEFNYLTKGFYFVSSIIMIILALFTLGYSLSEFVNSIFFKPDISIESIFKPVISLTLGLAIFDLAKTLLEQEVVFKSYSKNTRTQYKVLTKFLITIIIALLIESLMVVFKIALNNYSEMIYAFYLISGVSILILSLGVFIFLSKKS